MFVDRTYLLAECREDPDDVQWELKIVLGIMRDVESSSVEQQKVESWPRTTPKTAQHSHKRRLSTCS